MFCDDAEGWGGVGTGWEGGPMGRDMCIQVADTLHCMVETNTTL